MSTGRSAFELRFRAGRFENRILHLILLLQLTLAVMLVAVTAGWILLIFNSYFDPNRPTAFYEGVVPYLLGTGVVLCLLNVLYE